MASDDVARLREVKQKIAETQTKLAAVGGFAQLKHQVDTLISGTSNSGGYNAIISAINTVVTAQAEAMRSLADCDQEANRAIEQTLEDEKQRQKQNRDRRR